MKILGLFLCIGLASLAAAEPAESFDYLPASNPYRAIFKRLEHLPTAEREALAKWSEPAGGDEARPILDAAQMDVVRELTAAVKAASRQPLGRSDWPLKVNPKDPDNPAALEIPHASPMRKLAQMVTQEADRLPAGEAIDLYAAVARLGRQQRAGGTLIEQLIGSKGEGYAFKAVARRLNEFSTEDLHRLSTAWAELPPAPTLEDALTGERDTFVVPMLRQVMLPGFIAECSLSEGAGGGTGDFSDLRLSALIDFGGGERQISLEDIPSGKTFALREGRVVNGIELLSINFEARQAIIRRGRDEGILNLESKTITSTREARRQLRAFFGLSSPAKTTEDRADFDAWLAKVKRHPGGVEGYVDDLIVEYDRWATEQVRRAMQPDMTAQPMSRPDDYILRVLAPSFYNLSRNLVRGGLSAAMLQAAIQVRLGDLGEASAPVVDPWSEDKEGFILTRAQDGRFQLSSRYESAPEQPSHFKFAAPDAGFQRPSSH